MPKYNFKKDKIKIFWLFLSLGTHTLFVKFIIFKGTFSDYIKFFIFAGLLIYKNLVIKIILSKKEKK